MRPDRCIEQCQHCKGKFDTFVTKICPHCSRCSACGKES